MSRPHTAPLVRQVIALLGKTAPARLVVFVPRQQLGTALQQAVARERGGTAGLTATTIEGYATRLAGLSLQAEGQTALDAGPRFFLAEEALHALSDEERSALTGGQPLAGMIAPLARTFATLREHGVSPATYRRHAADSARQQAQAEAFAHYESLLDDRDLFDTTALFERAEALVQSSEVALSGTVWAIADVVLLSTVERQFVDALMEAGSTEPALYRLGPSVHTESDSPSAPSRSAAAQFSEAPRPPITTPALSGAGALAVTPNASLTAEEAGAVRFWTATGTRREVQAVFDDILQHDRPLDTIEIAYTSPDPYLALIDTLAERYDIPVSLSGGRALDATRPGQALRGFFDWVANGCPIPPLISLLRSGLLRLDVEIPNSDEPLDSRRAATLLAEKRYPDDCRNYDDTFDAWLKTLTQEAHDIDAATDADWTDATLRSLREKTEAVRALRNAVDTLLNLAQMDDRTAVSPSDLADGAETVLETYGPTPAPRDEEDERTPDQAARNRLIERLRTVQDLTGERTFRPPQLAGRMKTWLGLSPFVQAQRPRPGRAHVVPLESAGYANRDHLYVVGLDAGSTRSAVPDDPLLADEQRTALSDDSRTLPLRNTQADVEAWRTRLALARHKGPVTLSASTYDLNEDEDLFEAPLYLRLKDASQETRAISDDGNDPQVSHHALAPAANTLLSTMDRWTSRARPSRATLDEAMDAHPWIQHGIDAAAARASDRYTQYDGLLQSHSYPGLDPLSGTRPISAGRLETYAQAPYAYFLRHVLGVEPLDEPALDDVAWLDARGRGAVLHDTFKRFMEHLGRQPTRDDVDQLQDVFESVLEQKRTELPPPSEVVFASTRRQLWNDARLFLRAEAARTDAHTPEAVEIGFGYPPHRRADDDYADAPTLHLGDLSFPLRGRIDRVDRRDDGTFALWDYKTGSSRRYDDADLVGEGFHLQWALYAYAYEALKDATVTTAGYFFTSTDEMGRRVAASPAAHRAAVGRLLEQVSEGITAGAFPITDADAMRYSFNRLFHDYGERRKEVNAKEWPDDRAAPPSLRDD